jgi:hypothetical protein
MADLTVKEKYPNSFRINHPDFGDVSKTTYAKGVITDFQVVSTDPFKVKSMVKVSGDWGESGYILLFYHPKPKYWDPDSQKLNEDNSYEKAWMSFRGDDEVSVMLKEGTPVAALGFYEGGPRVGEDIFKLIADRTFWMQCSKAAEYASGDDGPDGKPLNLTLPCERIFQTNKVIKTEWDHGFEIYHLYRMDSVYLEPYDPPSPGHWILIPIMQDLTYTYRKALATPDKYIHHYLVPVGPILYCIQVFGALSGDYVVEERIDHVTGAYSPISLVAQLCYSAIDGSVIIDTRDEILAEAQADMADYNAQPPETHEFNPTVDDLFNCIAVYAALYSKKLYNDTKNGATAPEITKDTNCTNFRQDYPGFYFQGQFTVEMFNKLISPNTRMADAEIYVRPHTS